MLGEGERMRYFTLAWWIGIRAGGGGDPATDYARHLAAIRHRLSPNLIEVHESVPPA